MSTAAGRRSSILRAVWALAVLGALLVTLPLLALALLVLFSIVAVGGWSLEMLLIVLWPVAGVAGIVGLILARSRGPLGLRAVRARQALLLAGIAAAVPPAAALVVALADPQPESAIAVGVAAPFVVLILQGARDTWRLQALIPRPAEPEAMRISAAFLWLALICAVGAAAGHLAL